MLQFDAETTRILNEAYAGADVTARRRASFDALAPARGEVILDLGCGNGMLSRELAEAVGPEGRVIGIDPSADMLAAGRAHCNGLPQVEMREGSGEALPFGDGSVDKAVAVHVFEYMADMAPALSEVARVVRPGGRVVISDMHLGAWTWHSDDPARMARMIDAWKHHSPYVDAPAQLPHMMRAAGLSEISHRPHAVTDIDLRPDGIARMMIVLMELYAVDNGHVSAEEARDWAEEQYALAEAGRFFFAFMHFVTIGHTMRAAD